MGGDGGGGRGGEGERWWRWRGEGKQGGGGGEGGVFGKPAEGRVVFESWEIRIRVRCRLSPVTGGEREASPVNIYKISIS